MGHRSDRLDDLLSKIASKLRTQCEDGAQSASLQPKALACGQFYGEKAVSRKQRGIHGTAAALTVLLSDTEKASESVAKKLEAYLNERLTADGGSQDTSSDDLNVIKQSEILYALNASKTLSPETNLLRQHIVERLLDAKRQARSFPYFTDQDEENTIPTCYAFRALAIHDGAAEKTLEFLLKRHSDLSKDESLGSRVKRILIIYSIATSQYKLTQQYKKQLQALALKEYRLSRRDLRVPAEQTIDYYRESNNFYMRIPWQLYILISVAQLKPTEVDKRNFRVVIDAICEQVAGYGGLRYSSAEPSTRTNSIVYELLTRVRDAQLHYTLPSYLVWLDTIGWYATRPTAKWSIACVFILGQFCGAFLYHARGWDMGGLMEGLVLWALGVATVRVYQWARSDS